MRLILVRHSEPAWPDGWVGEDVGLTDRGRDQARATGRALAKWLPESGKVPDLLSSPSRRARQTAEIIAGQLEGATVTSEESLAGFSDPDMRRKLYETGVDAEVLAQIGQIGAQAWDYVQRLMEANDQAATFVAISHDVKIAALVCQTLSMPLNDFRRFRIDTGSITVLDLRPGRLRLTLLNDTHHLEPNGGSAPA